MSAGGSWLGLLMFCCCCGYTLALWVGFVNCRGGKPKTETMQSWTRKTAEAEDSGEKSQISGGMMMSQKMERQRDGGMEGGLSIRFSKSQENTRDECWAKTHAYTHTHTGLSRSRRTFLAGSLLHPINFENSTLHSECYKIISKSYERYFHILDYSETTASQWKPKINSIYN